jgi:hypothetical protein
MDLSTTFLFVGVGFLLISSLRTVFTDMGDVRMRDARRDTLLNAIALFIASIAAK